MALITNTVSSGNQIKRSAIVRGQCKSKVLAFEYFFRVLDFQVIRGLWQRLTLSKLIFVENRVKSFIFVIVSTVPAITVFCDVSAKSGSSNTLSISIRVPGRASFFDIINANQLLVRKIITNILGIGIYFKDSKSTIGSGSNTSIIICLIRHYLLV